MDKRRRIYLVTEGEYSDYTACCAFDTEEDAQRAVADGVGDDYRELILFSPGAQPKKIVTWSARAVVGNVDDKALDSEPVVSSPTVEWDYEQLAPVESRRRRPSVKVTPSYLRGSVVIVVRGAPSAESALKVCSDRYAKLRAERDGL